MRSYCLQLLPLCISIAALAAASSDRSRAGDEATRVEVDRKANVIRFVIDGQERALLDAAGLHVKGDLEFTGQTVDIGNWNNREAAHAP